MTGKTEQKQNNTIKPHEFRESQPTTNKENDVITMNPQQKFTSLSAIISFATATLESRIVRQATPEISKRTGNRSNQAEIFAYEEALLHEQLMIEQDILLRQAQASSRQPEPITSDEQEQSTQQLAPETLKKNQAAIAQLRSRQEERRQTISRKLELIRHRIAPKKVDNSAGIANLRAAIAA